MSHKYLPQRVDSVTQEHSVPCRFLTFPNATGYLFLKFCLVFSPFFLEQTGNDTSR